jgi:hypothetical protein
MSTGRKTKKAPDTTIGEFFEWARRGKWALRYFESAVRSSTMVKGGGWAFVWGTQCGFVCDADILKVMPKKNWDVYGR